MTDNLRRSNIGRYVALAILFLVVTSLLFPLLDGLSVAGFFGAKTYLLILQDNAEIRGIGGLMSAMGLVTMHNGNIASVQYYYRDSPELKTIVQLDGPDSFTKFFGINHTQLYLSNVQYDFASFAPKMQSDFYNVTGHNVDGVIAVDFTAVEAIMNVTGPITVSGQVMTSRNVADRLHYYSATRESGREMTALLSTLTFDLTQLIRDSNVPQKLALYISLQTLENEKHVLIYPDQGFWLRSAGGESRPPATDFISLVDDTLNTGKADFGVTRTINYHIQLFSDGSAISTLTLTYTNGCWWDYDVFSTTLVPSGAELIAAQNATHAFKGPLVTSEEGSTALSSRLLVSANTLSSRLLVSANTTGSVTYTYMEPNVASASGIGHHFDLYIQKQAGITRYILNASVQLPPGATMIHAENVGSNQVFESDAHMDVVYT
ncbi:MAG: DUF4012 domain-containing protein [Halobacteriota archaeon]